MSQNSHTSCHCGGHACDCCTGPSVLTPEPIHNVSGLTTLRRRVGTWDSFHQSMIARLSEVTKFPALAGLRTRETDDASIAILDAAAVVGDVLTFYQERLANEGYLGTATERRSLTELGKLVGYRPRPGVSASAWLAFSLDAGYAITIPAGTRVQSVPGSPDESAQTFETTSDLAARAELNILRPRPGIPQEISPANVINVETIWLEGIGLNLKPGDLLLFVFPTDEAASTPRKVHAVTEDAAAARTTVNLVVEKLSAAYYLPVLRKAAQAMRQSIPDAWLTEKQPADPQGGEPEIGRRWAKAAVAALTSVIDKLGKDTSLAGIEELLLEKNFAESVELATKSGNVAARFSVGLATAVDWKDSQMEAWLPVFQSAADQESLVVKIFKKLGEIDAANALALKKTKAAELVVLLAAGSTGSPSALDRCGPLVTAAGQLLRVKAIMAGSETTSALFTARIVEGRALFDLLEEPAGAKTAREEAMDWLEEQADELGKAAPAFGTLAKRLLNNGADSLKGRIEQAEAAGFTAVAAVLTEIQTALGLSWSAREQAMTKDFPATKPDDRELAEVYTLIKPLAEELKKTTPDHSVAVGVGDGLQKLLADQPMIVRDLATIERIGTQAGTLLTQQQRFQEDAVADFRAATLVLAGGHLGLGQQNDGPSKEAGAALETLIGEFHQPGKTTLKSLNGPFTTAYKIVEPLKGASSQIRRLETEMRILNDQVNVAPSGRSAPAKKADESSSAALGKVVTVDELLQPEPPADPLGVTRSLAGFLPDEGSGGVASDAVSRLAGRLAGATDDMLFDTWRKLNTGNPVVEVHVLRVQATVFGSGAPMRFGKPADTSFDARFDIPEGHLDWIPDDGDLSTHLRIEGDHGKVTRDSHLVIERPKTIVSRSGEVLADDQFLDRIELPFFMRERFVDSSRSLSRAEGKSGDREVSEMRAYRVADVMTAPHSAYSMSGKATTVLLSQQKLWAGNDPLGFDVIRRTKVYAASELLVLAEMPVGFDTGRAGKVDEKLERTAINPFAEDRNVLVLDGLYQGLAPGHRLLVAGERADSVSARQVREYALVSKVDHVLTPSAVDPAGPLPGDTPHTRITLSENLQYVYRRETVVIYGNVAEATHGEAKREVLGSGNARAGGQKFSLRSVPVTHVPAATAKGAASTVQLRVDRVLWQEEDQFTDAGPDERIYVLEIADDGSTHAVFGDGSQGARLPTGSENVTAVYRSGIGRGGNVRAESLSTLLDRPLGLKGVANPLPASGGADRDGPEDIRRNAPLPLMALDRLVSVSDYAAFSRAFAGIGKAESAVLSGAGGSFVHVTVAGQNDAPLDETSALLRSLTEALIALGDPLLPVRVQPRELLVLLLAAKVRIDADREWAAVEPAIRAAVLGAFGFSRREPGQDVFLSEMIAVIQSVPGVDFVDVDSFAGIPQKRATEKGRAPLTPAELEESVRKGIAELPNRLATELAGYDEFGKLRPAQMALFLPDMPETLILNQLVS